MAAPARLHCHWPLSYDDWTETKTCLKMKTATAIQPFTDFVYECGLLKSLEFAFEDALSVMAGDVFSAKLHRPGGTSSATALAVGGLDGSLPQFFLPKIGYSVRTL